MKTTCVLVDGPLEGDFRLLRSIAGLDAPAMIDIRTHGAGGGSWSRTVSIGWTACRAFARALPRTPRIVALVGWHSFVRPFAGLPACLRWLRRSVDTAAALRSQDALAQAAEVHAHDLYCGVAAIMAGLPPEAHLVYDSHELQIHRNRAAGIVRILLEAGLEQAVLRRADELHVVNAAIGEVMRGLYGLPTATRVRLNDFYAHHPLHVPPADAPPAVVYVGKGLRGRKLELLDAPANALGFDVFTFFLGTPLPPHLDGRHWHPGALDYERPLLALARSRRCVMWCCLDTTSLSYRLATPNKLFQALAMGMPVLASSGSYLADLVRTHGIGMVVDETNLQEIAAQIQSPAYARWVNAIGTFRMALADGSVVI